MLEFQLFRLRVYPPKQKALFPQPETPSEIIRETIRSHPSAELKEGMKWHVGNISELDDYAFYFRIGRTTTGKIEVYKDGDFVDEEFETAPYTHVLLDVSLELCAIAKKSRLARTTVGIAKRLVRLFNESSFGKALQARFEVAEINDPKAFIKHLEDAYRISKFWVAFSKPNAWDANEDFHKPMQKLLPETEGETGKTELQGLDMRSPVLEELARSAASTGNDASASIYMGEGQPRIRKRLKGNPVTVQQEDVANEEQQRKLLELIRRAYRTIRGRAGTENER